MPGHALAFGPRRGQAVVLLALGLALVAAGLAGDAGAALLAVPAGLVALGWATRDLLLPAALTADDDGLVLVRGLRRERADWSEVAGLRVVRDRRTSLLEVDLDDGLHVLARSRLGRDPAEVLAALEPLRSAAQR